MTGFDQVYELGIYDKWQYPWYCQFFLEGHSSAVVTLLGGEEPIKFEFQNESDDFDDPYRPSRVIIQLAVTENFLFTDLFPSDPMSCYVKIFSTGESAGDPYWQGWVDPSQFKEPYDVPPFYLEIVCVDGLTLLREILYVENEDSSGDLTYYTGRKLKSDIIYDILQKVGYSEFKEFINLYALTMNISTDDSIADQLLIDTSLFKDKYCDEVLAKILYSFRACIRQVNGVFCIYRPKDLIQATLYGRHFTNGSTKTSIVHHPVQYINRTATHPSAFRQIPGGQRIQQAVARPKIHFDFGNKESWIDNYKLHADTYDPVTEEWQGWTEEGGKYVVPIGNYVRSETEGVLNLSNAVGHSFYANFGALSVYATWDEGVVEFEYGFYSERETNYGPVNVALLQILQQGAAPLYLYNTSADEGEAAWAYGSASIGKGTVTIEPGWSGWNTMKVQFHGIYGYALLCRVASSPTSDIHLAIKNVKFYLTSFETRSKKAQRTFLQRLVLRGNSEGYSIMLRDKYYTVKYREPSDTLSVESTYIPVTNLTSGKVRDFDFVLGDVIEQANPEKYGQLDLINIVEQFAGALAAQVTESLINAAVRFAAENADEWLTAVILTIEEDSSGDVFLVFTAATAGVDFTGAASISPISGSLDGTPSTLVANAEGTPQIVQFTLTGGGPGGQLVITIGEVEETMDYEGSGYEDTINYFLATKADSFLPRVFSKSGTDTVIITGTVAGEEFEVILDEQGLTVGVSDPQTTQEPSAGTARVDVIQLSGTTGSATIWCNNDNAVMEISTSIEPTTAWMRYGGDSSGEAKPLLELIGDELAEQYSRPKDFIDMPILETAQAPTSLDIMGSFREDFNRINGVARAFVVNRGSFSVRKREWKLDLVEIIGAEDLVTPVEDYVEYSDGVTTWRKGVRDGYLCWDKELTATGFDGTEGVDWINIKSRG